MTVNELMKKLEKCNPGAEVYLDIYNDPVPNKVIEYESEGVKFVYLCDCGDWIEGEGELDFDTKEEK